MSAVPWLVRSAGVMDSRAGWSVLSLQQSQNALWILPAIRVDVMAEFGSGRRRPYQFALWSCPQAVFQHRCLLGRHAGYRVLSNMTPHSSVPDLSGAVRPPLQPATVVGLLSVLWRPDRYGPPDQFSANWDQTLLSLREQSVWLSRLRTEVARESAMSACCYFLRSAVAVPGFGHLPLQVRASTREAVEAWRPVERSDSPAQGGTSCRSCETRRHLQLTHTLVVETLTG